MLRPERRALLSLCAATAIAGCSACSAPAVPTDAASDGAALAMTDATRDIGARADVNASDAIVIRDGGPGEVQWFDEGALCDPIPAPIPWGRSTPRCDLPGCVDIAPMDLDQTDEIRFRDNRVLFDSIFLYDEFDENTRTLHTIGPLSGRVSATNTACGAGMLSPSRLWLSDGRTAVYCRDSIHWRLRIIDVAAGRQCTIATARRDPDSRGARGLHRLRGAWAWHENFDRAKDDVVILDDQGATPRRLTDQFGVKTMHQYNDRLYWFESNWAQGNASLRMTAPPYRAITTLWNAPLPVHRMSADVSNPARIVFEVARGDETAANHSDIYFADLSTIDTVPPRNLTNDMGSQFWPLILGDRVVFNDISNSTVRPSGAPSEPHDRWDLVLYNLRTGDRRMLLSDSEGYSSYMFTSLGVYMYYNQILAVFPIPEA